MSLVPTPARTSLDLQAAITDVRAPAANELSAVSIESMKDHLIAHAAAINANLAKNNLAAGAAPTATDDSSAGYSAGSVWLYPGPGGGAWICGDASVGAAVWASIIASGYGSTPEDVGTAAADAGSSSSFAKGDHVHASPRLARQFVGTEISGGTPLATTTGVIIADLTGGAFNLELPDPTTMVGYRWLIVDKYGAAGTHALTLLRNDPGDKINGSAASDLVLDVDGFAVELFCESPGEWICRPPTAGGASTGYVDAGDAATLASAESYADGGDATNAAAIAAKPSLGTGIVSVGTANADGSGTTAAKVDHVHAHGAQTDDTLHAVATKDAGGFVDKDTWDQLLGTAKKWILFFRETFGLGLSQWGTSVSGTGAAVSASTTGGMPCVRTYCGTVAAGFANLRGTFNNITASIYSQYFIEMLGVLEARPSVIGATDDYVAVLCYVGVTSSGAPAGDAFGFRAISSSGNWQATKWISGTPTDVDTGIATDLLLHRFRIEHVVGTSITWYIDGAQVAQITSSMPTISAAYMYPAIVYGVSYTSLATRAVRTAFARAAGKLATARN